MKRMINAVALGLLVCSASGLEALDTPRLPPEISGKWSNNEWGGPWTLKSFDVSGKTAVASLGRGGDSCGFSNVPATIKLWDGRTLEVEVRTRSCRFPVLFRIDRDGSSWDGVVENDVRTVKASGHDN